MLRNLLSALVIILFTISLNAQSDTVVFLIINGGNVKGFDKRWKNSDGSYSSWYQFNDRGRGDSIRATYKEDDKGFVTWMKAAGNDYMKNSIFEDFTKNGNKISYANNAEKEEKTVEAPGFYMGLKAFVGDIYKAFKNNNNKIKLLPYGEAKLQVLKEHALKYPGQIKKVKLVAVSGFGMTPNYTWVDENFYEFAGVSSWNSSIRKGYEKNIADLLAIQESISASYFTDLAKKLTSKTGSVVIGNVNLFDAVNAKIIPDVDVLIRDGVIQEVSVGKRINAKVDHYIDGKGKTILPGLWDMHVHFGSELDGILHLAAGVTHVRDMGNDSTLLKRSQQIKTGEIIGPDIEIMSGFIDGAGPLAAPTGALINNLQEGIDAIRKYAKQGYQQIKLYSSIKPEWVKPLADEAHKNNMRVAGHIPAFMIAEQAVAAGYDEITHMNMLALNFFGDTIDTRSPNRFRVPAKETASLDLNSDAFKKFIRLLKDKNIAVDPTVAVFENMFTARDGEMEPRYNSIVNRFPSTIQRNIRAGGGGLPVPEGLNETYLKSYDAFLKITKLLYDNGITIVAGTDGFPGFDLHRELELYVKAGIPAEKVLQIATYGTAKYIGKESSIGSIAVGRKADIIIVEGNPVTNISDIRNTRWIIRGNSSYEAGALYGGVSIGAK